MCNGMRYKRLFTRMLVYALCAVAAGAPLFSVAEAPQRDTAASVNPFIGTGGDPDDGIDLFPGAVRPFGMVQLSPDTEDHGFGYHWIHSRIRGFSMTHMSGAGCANEGDVFFTATTGPITTQPNDYQSPYSHQQEHASPGYYQVRLLEWGINAEMTATERTGVARFHFPAGQVANILVPISHTLNVTESASVRIVGDRRVEGFVENHGLCNRPFTYKVYFAMEFDRPFASFGTWSGDLDNGSAAVAAGMRDAEQRGHQGSTGAYATWPAEPAEQTVTAKVGISYVDVEGAQKNLQQEAGGKSFDAIRSEARAAWARELKDVQITGGTRDQRTVFYTAMYHSLLMPSMFDDVDGRYPGFDGAVQHVPDGHHAYTNFSGWDIYRSEFPLLCLLQPQRTQDMVQSVVRMSQQGGWMPRWPQINHYTNDMIGSPLSIAIATAWLDGLRDFDIAAAWQAMKRDATEAAPANRPYIGEEGVEWLNRLHYLPADKVDYGSVAKTLEYTLADAALARLAASLGKPDEEAMLKERALWYRNMLDPETHFFRPRNADGSWVRDFNPAQDGHGFVEGSGWHYASFAPADMGGLIRSVGEERFNSRMQQFFAYPVAGWYAQRYNPYNETDVQAPFAFYFSGRPWETERITRRVLDENYRNAPDGIPGNDDAGAMSSWAVLTMMGLYSVDPPSQAYEIVPPVFNSVVIHLHPPYRGSKFVVRTVPAGSSARYIRSAQWNGQAYAHNWIPFSRIAGGGVLQLMLNPHPDHIWGTRPADRPPSLSDLPQ